VVELAGSWAVRLDREVLRAEGPEAAAYLQGQLSQDVLALGDGASGWSWVLAPNGKVDALVRITRMSSDEWILDTDSGWGDELAARLDRFKLRTKVDISVLAWRALGIRGAVAGPAGGLGAVAGPAGGLGAVAVAPWPGIHGVDLLAANPVLPPGVAEHEPSEAELERILAGMPRMGCELTDKTIPAETGLTDLTVSFTKGCYTGQELVARIDSRGDNVARRMRLLVSGDAMQAGSELLDGDRPAGVVTSAAAVPDGSWVGLGYVRRGFEPPVVLRAGPNGARVEVRALRR
jgi:folate-binding protein YgfZ